MFTKDQLAKWRGQGFEFDEFFDEVAVEEKEIAPKKVNSNLEDTQIEEFLNTVELEFVKFLFKIRNANKDKTVIPYERFSKPYGNVKRERVFIAGKIFPILNLTFSGSDADGTKISLQTINMKERSLLFGDPDYSYYSSAYISIDNDKIRLFLPKNYPGVDFPKLMLDFLTNGTLTANTIGGEFPDYETYKLALRSKAQEKKKWKGEDGCWLAEDRNTNTIRWINGYSFIIKNKIMGRLAPFSQIYDFYNAVDGWIFRLGHRVKWCTGAKSLVNALTIIDGFGSYFEQNDMETILSELNLGICDYAITQFYDLIYGKYATTPLVDEDAYQWDKKFIIYEQGTVAPPIYNKTAASTIEKFQHMVDRDPKGWNGMSGMLFDNFIPVAPAFDDFDPPAKVTDDQFRIDLPLLMLYLNRHKPNAPSFIKHLNADGTLKEEYKKIIRPYAK